MRIVRQRLRRLVAPLLTAAVTVATGIAINAAFVTGRGLLWPWVLAAIGLALVQVRLSRPEAEHEPSDENQPLIGPDRSTVTAESDRHEAMVAQLHGLAKGHVRSRPMPVAWRAERSDHDPDAGDDVKVSGAAALSRYFLDISSRRLVILGKPGSGKTVLGWRIALDIADQQGPNGRVPVMFRIGTWNPFEETFEGWLEGQLFDLAGESGLDLKISEILPILDGFDEYSRQLRSEALTVLSGIELSVLPLILISRSDEYKYSQLWRNFLTDAAIVQVQPLPTHEIIRYLEGLPHGEDGSPLDLIIDELCNDPTGASAKALSSAFMLDIAGNEYLQQRPDDFLAIARRGDSGSTEDLLAKRFVCRRVHNNGCWSSNDVSKWLTAIAARSEQPFAFRPNELEIPDVVSLCIMVIAAVLPAAVLTLDVQNLPILLALVLVVGNYFGLMVFRWHTGHGPTLDPRHEIRLERAAAAEKAVITLALTTSLGFLGLMAPYVGTWIVGLGAVLGALLGALGSQGMRERLLVSAAGAICGLALGWAAYSSIHLTTKWRFVLAGLIIGAVMFIVVLAANFVGHVMVGQGSAGITTAPMLAAIFSWPIALWAGSVLAISSSTRTWFHVGLIDKVASILLYAIALTTAMILVTPWSGILLRRIYYALIRIFPIRLLPFLERFSQLGVLRQVGYSYDFKHPAILRTIKYGNVLVDR